MLVGLDSCVDPVKVLYARNRRVLPTIPIKANRATVTHTMVSTTAQVLLDMY